MKKLHNILVFLSIVIPNGIPIRRWGEAWRNAQEAHERQVHEGLQSLFGQGEIKRGLKNGRFRYYPNDYDFDSDDSVTEYPPK